VKDFPYAINLADLLAVAESDQTIFPFLIAPVVQNRLHRRIDPEHPDTEALVLECPPEQAEAIIEVIRLRYPKNRLRCYKGRTGR
jgi:hypothetical protein